MVNKKGERNECGKAGKKYCYIFCEMVIYIRRAIPKWGLIEISELISLSENHLRSWIVLSKQASRSVIGISQRERVLPQDPNCRAGG